jgi:hypothetical protein
VIVFLRVQDEYEGGAGQFPTADEGRRARQGRAVIGQDHPCSQGEESIR